MFQGPGFILPVSVSIAIFDGDDPHREPASDESPLLLVSAPINAALHLGDTWNDPDLLDRLLPRVESLRAVTPSASGTLESSTVETR